MADAKDAKNYAAEEKSLKEFSFGCNSALSFRRRNFSDHFFIDLAEMREIIIADLCGNQADRKY